MRRATIVLLLMVVASLVLFPKTVEACSIGLPPDDSQVVAGGKFILVNIAPANDKNIYQKNSTLRKTYKESGLYKNDGSTEPLWTMSFYQVQQVFSDGVYGISAYNTFIFYKNGKEVKKYNAEDMVVGYSNAIPPGSCVPQDAYKSRTFDDTNERFIAVTKNGDKFVFDKEGNLIEGTIPFMAAWPRVSFLPDPFGIIAFCILALTAVGAAIGGVVFFVRWWRSISF